MDCVTPGEVVEREREKERDREDANLNYFVLTNHSIIQKATRNTSTVVDLNKYEDFHLSK